MMPSASRSLTEPIGLKASSLTNRFTCAGASLLIRTSGVFPIVPSTLSNLAVKNEFLSAVRNASRGWQRMPYNNGDQHQEADQLDKEERETHRHHNTRLHP